MFDTTSDYHLKLVVRVLCVYDTLHGLRKAWLYVSQSYISNVYIHAADSLAAGQGLLGCVSALRIIVLVSAVHQLV